MSLKPLFNMIYFGEILIPAIEREQDVFDYRIKELKKYRPRTKANIKDKNNVLTSVQNFYKGKKMIIDVFKNILSPLYSGNYYEEFEEEPSESENEESESENKESGDKTPDISTSKQITMLDKFYDLDLINKYFLKKSLTEVLKQLKNYREKPETFQKYNNLMTHLIIGLTKLEKRHKKYA